MYELCVKVLNRTSAIFRILLIHGSVENEILLPILIIRVRTFHRPSSLYQSHSVLKWKKKVRSSFVLVVSRDAFWTGTLKSTTHQSTKKKKKKTAYAAPSRNAQIFFHCQHPLGASGASELTQGHTRYFCLQPRIPLEQSERANCSPKEWAAQ